MEHKLTRKLAHVIGKLSTCKNKRAAPDRSGRYSSIILSLKVFQASMKDALVIVVGAGIGGLAAAVALHKVCPCTRQQFYLDVSLCRRQGKLLRY